MRINKDLNIPVILNKLKEAFNPENNSYEAFIHDEIKFIILSHLTADDHISLNSREFFVNMLLQRLKNGKEFTEIAFNKEFANLKKDYFKKENVHYTLLTSISINYLPFKKININNSVIKIRGKKFPKKYISNRKELLERRFNKLELDNDNYLKVTVDITGKHYLDAFENALYDLNILRAILCLNLNVRTQLGLHAHTKKVINKVRFGYFASLHNVDGTTVNNQTYWTTKHHEKRIAYIKNEEKDLYKKKFKYWLNTFNGLQKSHKNKIGGVLNSYVNAFDESDKHTCFHKGWSTLEKLLDTDNNEMIIKRCISVYKTDRREYEKQILQGLRLRRNLFIHEVDEKTNPLVNCHHIQRYIYNLLKYNNFRHHKLISNNLDAIKLLDYSRKDIKTLDKEIKILERVKKINL